MAFQFGSNPAPAPSGGGGFSFGTAPTPGASGTEAPTAPASSGFNFAATSSSSSSLTNAPVSSGTTQATAFQFGNNNNTNSSSTPAPAGSGGGFGGTPAAGLSTSTGGPTPASASGTGFSLSSSSSTTPAPASIGGSGFSFGGATGSSSGNNNAFGGTTSSGIGVGTTPAPTHASNNSGSHLVQVPEFDDTFPGHVLSSKITPLVGPTLKGDSMAGQELAQMLSPADNNSWGYMLLHTHEVWKNNQSPDQNLRNQLGQQQEVSLRGRTATLLPNMAYDVFRIAEDLCITETEALSIYAEVERKRGAHTDIFAASRAVYFDERSQFSKTLLYLLQQRRGAESQLEKHRPGADKYSRFLEATDPLLQKELVFNLLKHIQEYSVRAFRLAAQINEIDAASAASAMYSMSVPSSSSTDHRKEVASAHWDFGIQEIQRAAECLQFISYNTQMEVREIVALIDTIQFLTTPNGMWPGMPILDPFDDAPSAYKNDPDPNTPGMTFTSALPPLREKDPVQWQEELIIRCRKSGKAPLLRCVSTLVLCVITALDTNQQFFDRATHTVNGFGKGNALLPPDHSGGLDHLDPIYAKLNPHAAEDWTRKDVFGVLMAAFGLLLRSVPYALVSPSSGGSSSMSGSWSASEIRRRRTENLELPASFKSFTCVRLCLLPALTIHSEDSVCRAEEFALDILVGFMAQYLDAVVDPPPVSRQKWLKDENEDLRLRQQSQKQQREFQQWSGTTTPMDDVPASVDLLERPDCMDDILACCVAVGMKGPAMGFCNSDGALLPTESLYCVAAATCADPSLRAPFFDYLAMLATAEDAEQTRKFEAAELIHSMLEGEKSTPDDAFTWRWNDVIEIIRFCARELIGKSYRSSRQTSASFNQQSTSYYYFDDGDLSNQTSGGPKKSSSTISSPKALGEENTYLLASCLSIVICVASRSSDARAFLRSFSLQVQSSDGIVGQDMTHMVLFTLASTAVPPEIRGLTFSALATIYQDCSPKDAIEGWGLVESTGFLPIYKLQQYPTQITENDVPSITFPTVQINDKQIKTWLPHDKSFSIIYEMEYVEASSGSFPSTIGFLRLLSALALNGGFPSNLGENWRTRTGCSPYIEYAMCVVLPRAAGTFSGCPALSFRSTAEKNRLCMAALELINVAAGQYLVPLTFTSDRDKDFSDSVAAATKQVSRVLGPMSLELRAKKDDFVSFVNDLFPGFADVGEASVVSTEGNQTVPQSALPPSKSAGFTVLTAALRTDGNLFFTTLAALLSTKLCQPISDAEELALSLSLFKDLHPSFDNSKSSKPKERSKLSKLLVTLWNQEGPSMPDSVVGLEGVVTQALKLLCTIASKEDAFASAINSARLDRMVPMLHFNKRHSSPDVWNLHFSRTRDKFESSGLVAALPFFMVNRRENITIPFCATALLFLLKDSSEISRHKEKISLACASMISVVALQSSSSAEYADLLSFFIGTLLKELKNERSTPLRAAIVCPSVLRSLTDASSSRDFLFSEKSARVAALCVESSVLLNRQLGTAQYLAKFWQNSTSNIWFYISTSEDVPIDVLRSIAWVVKGLADSINHSFSTPGADFSQGIGLADEAIRLLWEDGIIIGLYDILPIDKPGYSEVLSEALHLCLGTLLVVTSQASRGIDLGAVIIAILQQLGRDFDSATLRNLSLALYMSVEHANIPTAEIASTLCNTILRVPSSSAILIATLVVALNRSGPHINGQEIEHMLYQVSKPLFHMCCSVSDNANDPRPTPTSEASISRSALKLLFNLAPGYAVHKVLADSTTFGRKRTPLDEMVSLAGRLDSDICSLLYLVCQRVSLGTQELLRSNLLVALEQAGMRYRDYLENENVSLQSFPVPSFLCAHLQLCNVILCTVPENLLLESAQQVERILALYEPELAQMLSSFPSNEIATAEYLRTFSIILRVSRRFSPSLSPGARSLRSCIPAFVFSLLENPLPRACLGPIPKVLKGNRTHAGHQLTDQRSTEKSWWDDLKEQQPDTISLAIGCGKIIADMSLSGLYVVEHLSSISHVDPATLGRAIVAIVDSILFLDRNTTATDDFHLLRERFVEVTMELLRLSIQLVQKSKMNRGTANQSFGVIKHCLLTALDRVQLQTIRYSSRPGLDQTKQQLLGTIARKLRDQLA